jgi:hypothetical protein
MFLFNSLHQGSVASRNRNGFSSLRRHWARSVFALAVMLCLSTAFLFTGCDEDQDPITEDTAFIPVGEWADTYGGGYKITASSLEYYTAYYSEEYPGENIKGSIKEAVDFSKDAGVLLVQITESSTTGQAGKFFGVYYKDYTAAHVFLANAIDDSWQLIVKNTLAEAKSTFTVDNVGTHVGDWGSGYSK